MIILGQISKVIVLKMRMIDPDNVSLDDMIKRGSEFHGHLGPFLVLGIRMGLAALSELSSHGHKDISAVVRSGSRPPVSCLADGIQISTGCTLGKGNISVLQDGVPEATFYSNGRTVSFRVRGSIVERISELSHDELEDFSWSLSRMPLESIIERL
ncbi:MAG: formylmethanofuran dehydrogenase subunit E family protein [Methanothrix sp.]|uniref:formylmethanofuran dehydrogenase subunit E family protein n=1 Tax=Methanothrix sp. TaxID=90426 RepID=UPI00247D403E|nr:formylmethanofuran dehydrogenase subunit E family protein [Methanothrix sp.]